jgi:hypothetical protein
MSYKNISLSEYISSFPNNYIIVIKANIIIIIENIQSITFSNSFSVDSLEFRDTLIIAKTEPHMTYIKSFAYSLLVTKTYS